MLIGLFVGGVIAALFSAAMLAMGVDGLVALATNLGMVNAALIFLIAASYLILSAFKRKLDKFVFVALFAMLLSSGMIADFLKTAS